MKTAIIYYSKHHKNTKKLLDAVKKDNDITLIDAAKDNGTDLGGYDLIGFASGIYYSKFHKSVIKYAENNLPNEKKVFFVYTYGVKKEGYTNAIRKTVQKKFCDIVGEFGCLGFNTFGPFKLVGGIAKGHPNKNECDAMVEFFNKIKN